MINLKLVHLILNPRQRLQRVHSGLYRKFPPQYVGLLLKECEKSYCILLTGARFDKAGNYIIPPHKKEALARRGTSLIRYVSKERYTLTDWRDGLSIAECLVDDIEYLRKKALDAYRTAHSNDQVVSSLFNAS